MLRILSLMELNRPNGICIFRGSFWVLGSYMNDLQAFRGFDSIRDIDEEE